MTLSPWLGAAGMIILWHIRSPLLTLIFISVAFSLRTLGTGMHFQTLLSPLLKVPWMVLLSSLHWWELGTSLPGNGPSEWLSFWRVTSKQFWFWFWWTSIKIRIKAFSLNNTCILKVWVKWKLGKLFIYQFYLHMEPCPTVRVWFPWRIPSCLPLDL